MTVIASCFPVLPMRFPAAGLGTANAALPASHPSRGEAVRQRREGQTAAGAERCQREALNASDTSDMSDTEVGGEL